MSKHTPTWFTSSADKWPTSDEMRFCFAQDQRSIEFTVVDKDRAPSNWNRQISIQFPREFRKRWDAHDDDSWTAEFPDGPETKLREGCNFSNETLTIWRLARAALAKAAA